MKEQEQDFQTRMKEARKAEILEAAGRVFAEQGYHSAKMKDVAAAAGVSNGTVYNYFKSKEEVLKALLHRLNETEEREQKFAKGPGELGFQGFLEAHFQQRIGFLWSNMGIFRAVMPELLANPSLRKMYFDEVIGPGFELGEGFMDGLVQMGLLKDIDRPLAARMMAGSVFGLLLLRLFDDPVLSERHEELAGLLAEMMSKGFQADSDKSR